MPRHADHARVSVRPDFSRCRAAAPTLLLALALAPLPSGPASAAELGLLAAPTGTPPNAAAARLTPHRALYDISLAEALQGTGIVGADGVMYYRMQPLCAGWEVETRVTLALHYGGDVADETVETKWSFSSFETFDGRQLSFQVDHSQDGDLLEVYTGDAVKDGAAKNGSAHFYAPIDTTVDLPKETLYPERHLLRLLDAARAGVRNDFSVVFDGASINNPYEVNSIILGQVVDGALIAAAPEDPAPAGATAVAAKLSAAPDPRDIATWRIRMAFFPVETVRSAPDFELEVDYRSDGVASRIEQDFGDFRLDLKPSTVETLPYPTCR